MKRRLVIVDTNVPITANGDAAQASPECRLACIRALGIARSQQRIALDQLGLILQEYRRHLSPRGQPGVGDAFFKWLWNNQANSQVCTIVEITPSSDDREFAEFPADPRLHHFDRSDRKFVAVARAHPDHPPIINAVDTDWYVYQQELATHQVMVENVCDLQQFVSGNQS
ncbi:hypothetical protein [Chloroflexus sp.]|uniref:hypothetical protein n=1 Tax=Chloroflexus sp. TaxID=1904827 RepID=UPI00298EFC2D|nr:hypothetical protein [Chloroflexus sp.]MCS6889192.1 hypothetical protein [Chloroflexus sp.]MDW8405284.1 hypothetical protein [Chloroflexus sp.]